MRKTLLLLAALLLSVTAMWIDLRGSLAHDAAVARAPSLHSLTIFGPAKKPMSRRSPVVIPFADAHETPAPEPVDIPVEFSKNTTTSAHLETLLENTPMEEKHRRIAREVLSLMDPACQEQLQTFTVLYDNPKQRGLAGRGVVIVSGNVEDHEFMGLLMHEALGHFREITCLTGTERSGMSAFRDGPDPVWNDDPSARFYAISWVNERTRKDGAVKDDFVTGYAYAGDSFEDLAESVTYYMTQEDAFRTRAERNAVLAAKLAWIETYLPKTRRVAKGEDWNGDIAWDATKLAFEWLPSSEQ